MHKFHNFFVRRALQLKEHTNATISAENMYIIPQMILKSPLDTVEAEKKNLNKPYLVTPPLMLVPGNPSFYTLDLELLESLVKWMPLPEVMKEARTKPTHYAGTLLSLSLSRHWLSLHLSSFVFVVHPHPHSHPSFFTLTHTLTLIFHSTSHFAYLNQEKTRTVWQCMN